MDTTKIDHRIQAHAVLITRLQLCYLFLQKDGDVDWFVLVPDRDNLVNWSDLGDADLTTLNADIKYVSQKLMKYCQPTKINVANLGNIVPQFHVHVIARYSNDRAWPGPIWGSTPQREFEEGERTAFWRKKFGID